VPILVSGDTGETKRAAHRFAAIRMRSAILVSEFPVSRVKPKKAAQTTFGNQALRVKPVTPLSLPLRDTASGANRASVTIRLPILTPAQRVSRSCAETDVCSDEGACVRFGWRHMRTP
jgi:hypothetical protein